MASLTKSYSPKTKSDFGKLIARTDNSEVYHYGRNEVIKIMTYTASTARELSLTKALKGCDVVLSPRKETRIKDGQIGLIFPYTENYTPGKNLEKDFFRSIQILATFEKLGIVHLDFRPENLCLWKGEIYARDFGNAHLLSSIRDFLPIGRYPLFQIRAPEFQIFEKNEESIGTAVPIQSYQRNQALPEEFDIYYDPELLVRLRGSEFDCRADVWSLACWFYQQLEGVWPVNSITDYYNIKTDHLVRKYGKLGKYLKDILSAQDFRERPWASQIAQELSISANYFRLRLPSAKLQFKELQNATLQDLWAGGYRTFYPEDITSQYLWILLFAQRTCKNPLQILSIFLNEDAWDQKTIDFFEKSGRQCYTENILTSFRIQAFRLKYFELLRNPGDFSGSTLEEQREYLIKKDIDDPSSNLVLAGKLYF